MTTTPPRLLTETQRQILRACSNEEHNQLGVAIDNALADLHTLAAALAEAERAREEAQRLHCHNCGKSVSSEFMPVPTDTPDKGLIVRAWIECPECIERRAK